jgi:outer membrane immunogenic protein
MKKTLLGAAVTILGIAPALAADMAPRYTKAPAPAPMAVYNWTGCYVGGTLGGAWGRSNNDWTGITESATAFAAGAATVLPAAANARLEGSGFAAGGTIGCNYQTGRFVFGGEADIQWTDINTTRTATSLGSTNGGPATIIPGAITESLRSNWMSTIRGRAGFAQDRWLAYVTGGLAIADVRYFDQLCFGPPAAVPGCNTASSSETRTGWVVGAGLEWAVSGNWSVKAEYLYADLGNTTNRSLYTATAGGGNPFPNATINHNHNFVEQTARVGLNYRFNWAPAVVARY